MTRNSPSSSLFSQTPQLPPLQAILIGGLVIAIGIYLGTDSPPSIIRYTAGGMIGVGIWLIIYSLWCWIIQNLTALLTPKNPNNVQESQPE